MEEEKPEDRLKTGPVENDRKEVTGTSEDDFTGPVEICTDSDSNGTQDHGADDRIISLDVLAKGTPPPSTGDPSLGRNHVTATSSTVIDKADGAKDRVVLFEASGKSTHIPSVGATSSGRNTISPRASTSISSQSTSHGVNEHKPDESK